jgi:pimeloyl-ACP methyl ester carboxylesterase
MNRSNRDIQWAVLLFLIFLAASGLVPGHAIAQQVVPFGAPGTSASVASNDSCYPYLTSNGAYHVICMPQAWNNNLIVYAHGYVSPEETPTILFPLETDRVAGISMSLGFAFATTTYPAPGLVLPEAIPDLMQLVNEFRSLHSNNRHVFLVGASEGGLVTTKAVELRPDYFSGGLACCGPVGDFRKQINYFGDFFVVFNYFFPNFFPGKADPSGVSQTVIDGWNGLAATLPGLIATRPSATRQVLKVTNASIDPGDANSVAQTFLGLLWYDVFATNDALSKLGGQPFENTGKWYSGSDNDWLLNRNIARFKASRVALGNIAANYQTTGKLTRPLVTLHTSGDPIVPYWHEDWYWWKTLLSGSWLLHTNLPVVRYGHCTFTDEELTAGFALLVLKATGQDLLAGR